MIRLLQEPDAQPFINLRHQALLETPLAFASSPQDDFTSSIETVLEHLRRAPDSIILGAFQPDLIGTFGLYRDPHLKSAHKVHLWGMYVAPDHRGKGIATSLIEAAIIHARTLPGVSSAQISVSSAAPAAYYLYEKCGFQIWGTEPDALRHEGRTVVEHHMAFQLESDPG